MPITYPKFAPLTQKDLDKLKPKCMENRCCFKCIAEVTVTNTEKSEYTCCNQNCNCHNQTELEKPNEFKQTNSGITGLAKAFAEGQASEREKLKKVVEGKKFTQMDIAKNADLSFFQFTPTEIYNKAVDDILRELNKE